MTIANILRSQNCWPRHFFERKNWGSKKYLPIFVCL